MNNSGHGKVILKNDQEPAINDLQHSTREEKIRTMEEVMSNIRSIRGFEDEFEPVSIVPEQPPVGESQSNGAAETASKRFQGQVRTIKLYVEEKIKTKIDVRSNLWYWLVEHSADIFSRYKVGLDGVTPYKRINGRESIAPIASFGEKVYYHITKREKQFKDNVDPSWKEGIFLGMIFMSSEYIIGTTEGVIRSHSMKRMTDEQSWDRDALENLKGIPWRPDPLRHDHKIPTMIRHNGESGRGDGQEEERGTAIDDEDVEEVDVHEPNAPRTRTFAVTRSDITKYGMRHHCRGCT